MYEIFEQLLQLNKVTPYKVAKETGIATATLTDWKKGRSTPKQDKLQKIADYFGVSIDYLMGGKERDKDYYLNDETKKIAQEIFENRELKMLFDAGRNASAEDLKMVHDLLLHLQRKEKHND
jgi:transcriptional regulator with XRE-family HTH domain